MARTVLKDKDGGPLRDCQGEFLCMGDTIVMSPYGGYRLRKGVISRETASSIFVEDMSIRKNRCYRNAMKL